MVLKDAKDPILYTDDRPKGQTVTVASSLPSELIDPDVERLEPDELDEDALELTDADTRAGGAMATIVDSGEEEKEDSELQRVECLQHDAIINGHRLAHGHVIEMNMHDVYKHRRHGVAISDPLPDDDKREVDVDVTEPFQPEQDEAT